MSVLILDPEMAREICDDRETRKLDRWDEVWSGVRVVAAVPNNEHQWLVMLLASAFLSNIDPDKGDRVQPGANVSDRSKGWKKNYRIPDVLVFLAGNPAVDCGTHWRGGPDLAVEIVSPGDQPKKKLAFYAKIGTRELLVIDRDPWRLELYRLTGGVLEPVGDSDLENASTLNSAVLPLTFELRPGPARPVVHMTQTGTGQTWSA